MLRPRPPAHKGNTSRTISSSSSPPPPYVTNDDFSFDKPLVDIDTSDPIRATAMMLGVQLDTDHEVSPTTIAQVAEKSREELANLFLEAEKVIRARETELALAANLGKSLLETNQALKLRYDALIARLPVSQPAGSSSSSPSRAMLSPTLSPPKSYLSDGDQWTTDEEVSFRIPSAISSPVRSRANSSATLDTSTSPTHQRRISASPAALLALQETNNELITELTRLRSETDVAQTEGATRLRKLEQEIRGLRSELEVTQRTNAELEERMHAQKNEEQRALYEERVKKFRQRRKTEPQGDIPKENKDFAPPPELQKTLRRASSIQLSEPIEDSEPVCPNYEESIASVAPSMNSTYSAISAGEYAVVAQLYKKVEELQTANKELATKNRATKEQLSRAERNAHEIKRMYDTIRAELGSDADTDADIESSSSDDDDSRRLRDAGRLITPKASIRSLRHSATRSHDKNEFVRSRRDGKTKRTEKQVDIERTITPYGSSASRAIGNKNMVNAVRLAKARKPLSNSLFTPPSEPPLSPKSLPCSRSSSPVPTSSSALLTPRSQTPTLGSTRSKGTVRRNAVVSQRTLGSELGSELNSMKHILTPGSMHDGMPCTAVSDDDDLPAVAELRRLLNEDEFLNLNSISSVTDVATSISANPTIVLNSPSSRKTTNKGALSRPHLPTLLDSPTSSSTLAQRRTSRRENALVRMASERENEFLSVARSVVQSFTEHPLLEKNESDEDEYSSPSSTPPKGVLGKLRLRSEDVMLELWLYLQFIIIVGFFLYTMAKRGPRDVMGLPPRRQ